MDGKQGVKIKGDIEQRDCRPMTMTKTTITKRAVGMTRGNRVTVEVSPEVYKIIKWIESNSNGHDWMGTVRYVSGSNIYQVYNCQPDMIGLKP